MTGTSQGVTGARSAFRVEHGNARPEEGSKISSSIAPESKDIISDVLSKIFEMIRGLRRLISLEHGDARLQNVLL